MSLDLLAFVGTIVALVGACLSYIYFMFTTMKRVKVSEIWIYPIKSCKGIRCTQAVVSKRGFCYDRLFMLVDMNNKFTSQRTFPRMSLIELEMYTKKGYMIAKAPGQSPCKINLEEPRISETLVVDVWGDSCEASEVDEDTSKWFSAFLGSRVRLVRMTDVFVRKTDPKYAPNGQTGFSDGFPFLLVSNESLVDLNRKLDKPITMANFRPNIVVEGGRSFEEDSWKCIIINKLKLNVVKPCSRCQIPTIDPNTGEKDPEGRVSKALKEFRTGKQIGLSNPKWGGDLFFGQNLDHEAYEGILLSVGDSVLTSTV